MANTAANVSVGKPKVGGAVCYKTGTVTPPASTTEALTGYTQVGYCSEDGLKNTSERETSDIKAWGGDVVLKSTTGYTDSFTVKLIESVNIDALKLVYGSGNVSIDSQTSEIEVQANAKDLDHACFVVDMVLNGNKVKRVVIPDGQVTEVGEIVYNDSEAIGYGLTITAYPDASGNTHYEYIK